MTLDASTLSQLHAALRGGAAAGEAVAAVAGPLDRAAHQARLGRPLAEIAADLDSGDPATDFLLRCLALAERTGSGATEAVEHAMGAIRDQARLDRLIAARTAQARGTALILAALPVAVWLLLVALDVRTVAFYATPAGGLTGGIAVALAVVAWRWMHRLIRTAADAAARADTLTDGPAPPAWRVGVGTGVVVSVVAAPALGPVAALLAGAMTGTVVALRRRPRLPEGDVGAAEAVDLIAVALTAGLSPAASLSEAAAVARGRAASLLSTAAGRVRGGWGCDEALAGTPLEPVGCALAAAQRWGAPAAATLRDLAADLRDDRRGAVDVATERLQLALVFPTTLLTLPAFVLAVVPPLLWSTLR